MTLKLLAAAFAAVKELPVEIPDVQAQIISLGIQDEIICTGVESDPGKCRGVFYQFIKRKKVYGEPVLVSLIAYSSNLSVEWQRVVCAKELIHILDQRAEQTRTEGEVNGLIEKLLGPLSTEDFGLADLMAAVDKLAMYQALTFLFPDAARADAIEAIKAGKLTVEEIAAHACLPITLVGLVLSDAWPETKNVLLNC